MPNRYSSDHSVGDHNIQKWGVDVHHPVFWITAFLIILFVIGTVASPEPAKEAFDGAKGWSIANFDWLFMAGANIFVLFCLALIVLPVGNIRIGGNDAKPEFSIMSWFAMLFAAGMGIGFMLWSVAEPVGYYTDWFGTPLNAPPN
ncbi:MAG: BCCT family transporter, partial [Rhodospirillaceae bacterium]